MSKASDALELVKQTLWELREAGWTGKLDFPKTPEGGSAEALYFIRPFLMWHVNMEEYEGTMVALSKESLEQSAFDDLPGNSGMAVNAVLNLGETLESVLDELPVRIERARTLLDGPAAHFRQIGMAALNGEPI